MVSLPAKAEIREEPKIAFPKAIPFFCRMISSTSDSVFSKRSKDKIYLSLISILLNASCVLVSDSSFINPFMQLKSLKYLISLNSLSLLSLSVVSFPSPFKKTII